ncbi:NAD(P)-dependent oxidoreductase [Streptomyces sp. MP131-18]|uniref:NAD(P)-dependent oxidoreductase n=1 Tax=Streptomyces sp. MP131-18 TaxID=1857892 RepID=UPI00097BCFD8|nr:SDR family oxidoreductase [Streptomyces sp. MP131-18]ONK15536.1 putative NADH-flavin reductase [Streptomyces sp. MP131-18]
MKLVIFGASGPTGRLATEQALAEGHSVTAVTRRPDAFPAGAHRPEVVGADVMDAAAVDRAVAGHDAVISTLGVPYTKENVTVYSQGAAHIARAMAGHGVRRLVCVSSIGVTPEHAPGETLMFRKVIAPILLKLGRTIYADMGRMEELLRGTDLEWTVLRPAGLFDGDEVTDYVVGEPRIPGRFTSRRDLADALVRAAVDGRHVRSAVEVITTRGVPSYFGVFVKEALHIGNKR